MHVARAGEPEPGVLGSWEPEPLEKKQTPETPELLGKKSGAGAAKKLAGSSALREDKKHEEILYFRYSSKKTLILLVLYFFCSFTLLVCGEKNITYKLAYNFNSQIMFISVSL